MQALVRFSAATRQPLGEARGPAAAYANQYKSNPAGAAPQALQDAVGIGMVLGVNERGEIVLEDLASGWPAALSALRCGDVLLAVNGMPLAMLPPDTGGGAAMTVAQRLSAVREIVVGPRDSAVKLTVRHASGSIEDVQVRRQSGPPRGQDSPSQHEHDAMRAKSPAGLKNKMASPGSAERAAARGLAHRDIENVTPNSRNRESRSGGVHQQQPPVAGKPTQPQRQSMPSTQLSSAAAASAVLENGAGARMGEPTADWSSKLLQREDRERKDVDTFQVDHVDVDSLPGPPPALHPGIFDAVALNNSAQRLLMRHSWQSLQQAQLLQHSHSHTLPRTVVTNLHGSTAGESKASSHGALQHQPLPLPPQQQQAQAIYEHRAERADELSFARGDILSIIGRGEDDGWLLARNSRMHTGLVPHNYIRMFPPPAGPVVSRISGASSSALGPSSSSVVSRTPSASPVNSSYSNSTSTAASNAAAVTQSVDDGQTVNVKTKPTVITPGKTRANGQQPGTMTWLQKLGDSPSAAAAAAATHQQGQHVQPGQICQSPTAARSPSPARGREWVGGKMDADAEMSTPPTSQAAISKVLYMVTFFFWDADAELPTI
jgi:hypothetical protein